MKKPELYDHIWDDDLMQLYERQMDDYSKPKHSQYKPVRSGFLSGLGDACLMIMGIPVMLFMFVFMWVINMVPFIIAAALIFWVAKHVF